MCVCVRLCVILYKPNLPPAVQWLNILAKYSSTYIYIYIYRSSAGPILKFPLEKNRNAEIHFITMVDMNTFIYFLIGEICYVK